MSVIYESQVVAMCDFCNAIDHSSVHTLASFKKKLRQEGWRIDKETLCSFCNAEKRRMLRNESCSHSQ